MTGDPLFDLEGRVAIVTGGAGQLGQAYVAGLVERGVRVASFDLEDGPVPDGARAYAVDVTDRAAIQRGLDAVVSEWGVPHVLINNAGTRLAAGRAGRGGRPVRGLPRGLVRRGHGREREGDVPLLPGRRRSAGARGAWVDRQRLLRLRNALAGAGAVRVPARARRDVRQAGRLLGLEVGGPQPHALPGHVLGDGGRAREHRHARGGVERPAAGVPRRLRAAVADGPHARRARGARRGRVPRLRRVVVRHRRRTSSSTAAGLLGEPARGREPHRRAGATGTCRASGSRSCDRRTRRSSAASRARAPPTSTTRWPPRGRRSPRGPSGRPSRAATSCASSRCSCATGARRPRRIVVEETGKPEELALGETDAAVEMGLFVAGEGRRSYGRTTTASMANRTVLTVRQPLGVAALIMSFNTPLPNVAWKAFPAIFCGNAAVVKPSEHTPASASLFAELALEAGVPDGVLNVVHGLGREAGAPLVAHHGRRPRQLHRLGGDRPRDQRGSGASAREDVPRARRQERARRLRRRRPRERRPLERSPRRSRTRGSAARRRAGSSCSTPSTTTFRERLVAAVERARAAAGDQPGAHGADARERRRGRERRARRCSPAGAVSSGRAGMSRRRSSRASGPSAPISHSELFGPVTVLYRVVGPRRGDRARERLAVRAHGGDPHGERPSGHALRRARAGRASSS